MRRVALLLSIVGVVALAACGGGGGNKAAPTTSSSTTSAASSSSASGGTGVASNCVQAASDYSQAAAAAGAGAGGSQFGKDQAFAARDALKALARSVKDSDTQNALNTLAGAYDKVGNALGDYKIGQGVPPQGAIEALQEFGKPE